MAGKQYAGDRVSIRVGDSLVRADYQIEERGLEGEKLVGITIQTVWTRGNDYLIVGRLRVNGEAYVAFHSADTLYEAIRGFCERYTNRTLEWKEDQYA